LTTLGGLVLALHLASLGPGLHPALSVRDEVRLVATETVRRKGGEEQPWSRAGRGAASAAQERLRLARGDRPEDWFESVATQLHLETTPVVRAALWLASQPVQVEASTHRVCVSVRIAG
jgi:hypothetical protein